MTRGSALATATMSLSWNASRSASSAWRTTSGWRSFIEGSRSSAAWRARTRRRAPPLRSAAAATVLPLDRSRGGRPRLGWLTAASLPCDRPIRCRGDHARARRPRPVRAGRTRAAPPIAGAVRTLCRVTADPEGRRGIARLRPDRAARASLRRGARRIGPHHRRRRGLCLDVRAAVRRRADRRSSRPAAGARGRAGRPIASGNAAADGRLVGSRPDPGCNRNRRGLHMAFRTPGGRDARAGRLPAGDVRAVRARRGGHRLDRRVVGRVRRPGAELMPDPASMAELDDIAYRRPTEDDYTAIIRAIEDWWGGRQLSQLLPRLWLQHFTGTSWLAEDGNGRIAGFLIGFLSPDHTDTAYCHMIATNPNLRRKGLGRALYERFFDDARADGRTQVKAITWPGNRISIGFHRSVGFEIAAGPGSQNLYGTPAQADYDFDREDRAVMLRRI